MAYVRSFNDRAQDTVIAILKIIDAAEQESDLDPRELRFRLWQFVRGDYADLALQMACKQEPAEPSTYDMGPPAAIPNVNGLTFEETKDAIVSWFFDNFEDPAESTPYEGEYIYIWGGPYDAREEIDDAFGAVTSVDVIDAAAEQIEHDGYEWAPSESRMREERAADSKEGRTA
jgi:hypothetical protein